MPNSENFQQRFQTIIRECHQEKSKKNSQFFIHTPSNAFHECTDRQRKVCAQFDCKVWKYENYLSSENHQLSIHSRPSTNFHLPRLSPPNYLRLLSRLTITPFIALFTNMWSTSFLTLCWGFSGYAADVFTYEALMFYRRVYQSWSRQSCSGLSFKMVLSSYKSSKERYAFY